MSGSVENTVGLLDTSGLDLFHGYSVWPHYTPQEDPVIEKLIADQGFKILAIPEYTGIHFSSTSNKVCGTSSVTVFNGTSKNVYPLKASVRL